MGITADGGRPGAGRTPRPSCPTLWDVNIANFPADARTRPFRRGGRPGGVTSPFVKQVTTRPVLTVGRYTSPDRMVSIVKAGLVRHDRRGAPLDRRPLPAEEDRGRPPRGHPRSASAATSASWAGRGLGAPIRCTQNPTMGEEWRRGWHPETIPLRGGDGRCSSSAPAPAGAGGGTRRRPAGIRGDAAEATVELGGRAGARPLLPGLATFARVKDWRLGRIAATAQRGDLPRQRARRRAGAGIRFRARLYCHRRALAGGRHRPFQFQPHRRSRAPPHLDARRRDGGQGHRRPGYSSTTTTTSTWAGSSRKR